MRKKAEGFGHRGGGGRRGIMGFYTGQVKRTCTLFSTLLTDGVFVIHPPKRLFAAKFLQNRVLMYVLTPFTRTLSLAQVDEIG